jgi:CRISPR/Cas system type I-B associated protein Csh2 (Cas7 group RAMP superfamily)
MKKNHSPGGTRIGLRVLLYSFVFLAVIGTRETLSSDRNGPVSINLGVAFNRVLMTSSKLGLGVALLNQDKRGENTMIGRYSLALGIASHKAFVSSAKVDLFAR